MAEASSSKVNVYCCNPFKQLGHDYHKKNVRTVNDNIVKRHKDIVEGDKICDSCRKAVLKLPEITFEPEDVEEEDEFNLSTPEKLEAIEVLNTSLTLIDETPVKKKRLNEKKYPENKIKKITEAFRTKILGLSAEETVQAPNYDSEIISQLKEKFKSTTNKSVQMQILTTLPKSWTINQIEKEFGVTNFIARKAKNLVKEKGIMSSPNPKPGKTLSQETADLVKRFYESDEVSRQMPGKKDFVSVKINGKRTHVQKYLILNTLRESFVLFKERHPEHKVGFSKFCELRPKHCVLPGSAGTHAVCVCTTHQNAKLMMAQCKLPELINNDIKTYKDLTRKMICDSPSDKCYFRECDKCPDMTDIKTLFEDSFEENSIEQVTYKKWMQVDNRCVLETVTAPIGDFVDSLFDSLPKLLKHSFIATKQSCYLKHMKENLPSNHCIVLCDFAENYSFVLQDAAQGFHWNNAQATIHPFVIYYLGDDNKLMHLSLAIISNCMTHDTIAVHLFQRHMIQFLKEKLPNEIEKIHYFSDGASSQYKNKTNFLNLCHHKSDFSVEAEWNFFASSHGKNACDGVGGSVKRLAALASLRMVGDEQITTPRQLFDWAKENIVNIDFIYSSQEEYEHEKALLKERLEEAKTLKGTRQFHFYQPKNETRVLVKTFSFSSDTQEEIVSENDADSDLDINEIFGFVTSIYDKKWWLGCVLSKENDEVEISFLEPHGPSPSYKYPRSPDILVLNKKYVLTKVDPTTQTGRVYHLTQVENEKVTKKLHLKLKEKK